MRVSELLWRAMPAMAVAAGAGLGFGERACAAMSPLFRPVIEAFAPGVVVRGLDVVQDGGTAVLVAVLVPAQAAMAVTLPPGTMLVSVTVGGLLVPVVVALAVALAWPLSGVRDACLRTAMLGVLLPVLMLGGPLTLAAEARDALREMSGQGGIHPLMVLSRLLMGGGSAALGLAAGAVVVLLALRCTGHRAGPAVVSRGAC